MNLYKYFFCRVYRWYLKREKDIPLFATLCFTTANIAIVLLSCFMILGNNTLINSRDKINDIVVLIIVFLFTYTYFVRLKKLNTSYTEFIISFENENNYYNFYFWFIFLLPVIIFVLGLIVITIRQTF